jgi:hypothetical protein
MITRSGGTRRAIECGSGGPGPIRSRSLGLERDAGSGCQMQGELCKITKQMGVDLFPGDHGAGL